MKTESRRDFLVTHQFEVIRLTECLKLLFMKKTGASPKDAIRSVLGIDIT